MLLLLSLVATAGAAPADTCRFDLPGTIYRSPDAPMMVIPLLPREAVDSLDMYSGWLFLGPGTVVPEHEHDGDEMLWVVCGGARFRSNGVEESLTPGRSLRIPRGTRHAAIAGPEGLVAVQVYRPGAAARRFYAWPSGENPPR